ncbi:hypothetical protein SADUNF_Sadunf16G0078000 [Salix dunnii]|uniref:Uncharacterized protein n=1 Tax=Salix dunnii TaxID=1413687 RepID=A0A835J9T7_9ROSI|nr:hypothetical protein SADUNF_Sadunf16G0078000 [Salix dunnii]
MWQLLLTGLVAGSTAFIAKHIFTNHYSQIEKCEEEENLQESTPAAAALFHSSLVTDELCFCLKKRTTGEFVAARCESCSSEDSCLFGWGLGVGIMYMMFTGKAEISKLSTSMEEMSKVLHELRTELYKRKSTHAATSSKDFSSEKMQLVVNRTNMVDRESSGMKLCGLPIADDVEYPSSILTEEREPGVLEMDRLEAELESELQKLPWSSTASFGHNVTSLNLGKVIEVAAVLRSSSSVDVLFSITSWFSNHSYRALGCVIIRKAVVSSEGFCELECHRVLPSELDKKLCRLLIEQQENQIMGLESELHLAQSQRHEKEAELQALKDRLRSLTEFSLSDDEVEKGNRELQLTFCSLLGKEHCSLAYFTLPNYLVALKDPRHYRLVEPWWGVDSLPLLVL